MKLNSLNLLRGGVFSLAVVAAFAFTTPMNSTVYGTTDNGITWYDATNLSPVNDYRCEIGSENCLYNSMDINDPVIDTEETKFTLLTPQTPVSK